MPIVDERRLSDHFCVPMQYGCAKHKSEVLVRAEYPDYKKIVVGYARGYGVMLVGCVLVGAICVAFHAPDWVLGAALAGVGCCTLVAFAATYRSWAKETRRKRGGRAAPQEAVQLGSRKAWLALASLLVQLIAFLGLISLIAGLIARVPALAIAGAISFGMFLVHISVLLPLHRAGHPRTRHKGTSSDLPE